MQKKSSVFKFLLPYIVILGVIIGLFIMVGNGSTQAINLEAQGFEKVVEVQKKDGYLVTDYKKKDDPSDDIYFKITFKSVEVEESSTVTGFSGKFELVKVENPVIDNSTYVVGVGMLNDKEKATYSFSFIVSNNDPKLLDVYASCSDLSEFGVYYQTHDATSSSLGLTLLINLLPIIIIGVIAFFMFCTSIVCT